MHVLQGELRRRFYARLQRDDEKNQTERCFVLRRAVSRNDGQNQGIFTDRLRMDEKSELQRFGAVQMGETQQKRFGA